MVGTDCGCLTHDGPHWRHMDALWRERNLAILERAKALPLETPQDGWRHHLALLAFVQEESRRLHDKAAELEREESRHGVKTEHETGQGTATGGALS